MIDSIALYTGYLVFGIVFIMLIGFIIWLSYIIYNIYLKRLLGWNNPEIRTDILYFIKHSDEIKNVLRIKVN